MSQIMIAPGKYVQGPGEMKNISEYVAKLGKNALCLITAGGMKRFEGVLSESFKEAGIQVDYELFNGECSKTEINRIMAVCKEKNIDVVIGVGGGKIFDTIKAVGYYLHLPVVIVPTIAASDAPCSALSVIYTDDGVFEEYLFLTQNPNLVLVDTDVIAKSPTRLLVSGMGDALATYFEARACEASSATSCAGGMTTQAAMALAELCYQTLLDEGLKAKIAADQNVSTKALEKIVEANTLLSGIGFESAGLAGAHAVHNGLTALEETHGEYHGEKVAFGTLVQLVLENVPTEELEEVLDFCYSVGLPMTLEQLGVKNPTEADLRKVAELAAAEGDTLMNMPFPVTVDSTYAAIVTADAIGREFLKNAQD